MFFIDLIASSHRAAGLCLYLLMDESEGRCAREGIPYYMGAPMECALRSCAERSHTLLAAYYVGRYIWNRILYLGINQYLYESLSTQVRNRRRSTIYPRLIATNYNNFHYYYAICYWSIICIYEVYFLPRIFARK